ncbi:hypothetical protein MNBD_GAMMA25-1267 [hydrothermal vent metagenome]|uniref:Uncharacterized protein n=1 Tax=hydrothermal vent metagenome TaxID=652676 RepID=A0A3B1AUT6_9ZZZZ
MNTGTQTINSTGKVLPSLKNPFIKKMVVNLRNAERDVVILHAEACASGFRMLNGELPETDVIDHVSVRLKKEEERYQAAKTALLRLNIDITAIAMLSNRERLDLFSHYFTIYTPTVPDAIELFSLEEMKALVAIIP